MIDLQVLRTDPDRVRISQTRRGEAPELVDTAVAADRSHRSALTVFERMRAEQKDLGRQVAQAAPDERPALLARTKDLAAQVKVAEAEVRETEAALHAAVAVLSNLVDLDAPIGGEYDFRVVDKRGRIRDFEAEGVPVRDHLEIGEALAAIDVARGAKVSGSRFYYLTGQGALLELALVNLAMDLAQRNGFTPMIPPSLVRPAAMDGTGFLVQAAENVYHLPDDDMYLVGTAEVPLAAYHSDEILEALPLRYVGFSPCFRREAGSHGKDTRGIFRVHWFDKVEMFVYCAPEDAAAEHDRLLQHEMQFLEALEIPYRIIDVATGDLGASAARKYDCEAWIPSQQRYRELTSTSNCTTYQSRRLRIRSKTDKGTAPVATLNGTLTAITRTIVALLENHQQADGSVAVPAALQPYLGGRTALTPVG
ncbi:MAG: serine--tRNA ligase [Candidatus Nanopelagicales bacterium]